MSITASQVKELRERTGAGMMECKKALVEVDGDIDAAIEHLRKAGLAKADKKASRVAAEGRIALLVSDDGKSAVIVEVNCETDFVAGGEEFADFVNSTANVALSEKPISVEQLSALKIGASTIEEARRVLIAKIGENVSIRRIEMLQSEKGRYGQYMHGTRIGVLVDVEGGDNSLAKDLAMHIAASKPAYVATENVPPEDISKEREIFMAQAAGSGKPEEIVAKMVDGRIRKYLSEITLLGQPFVKDPNITVEKLLQQAGGSVAGFVRFKVGEGIEKKVENFADEVRAQAEQSTA